MQLKTSALFSDELSLGIKVWERSEFSLTNTHTRGLQLFILIQPDRISVVLYSSDQSDLFMPSYQTNMSRKGVCLLRVTFYLVSPEAFLAISEAPVS